MQLQMSISMPIKAIATQTAKSIVIEDNENALTKAKEWVDESQLILNLYKNKTVKITNRNEKINYSIKMINEDIEQKPFFKF